MHCCRTCLATSNLNPIFQDPNKCNSYSRILLLTTGIKININDNLPQLMCTKCICIVNNHIPFLEQCLLAQSTLLSKSNNIKTEVEYTHDVSNIENETTCSFEITKNPSNLDSNEDEIKEENIDFINHVPRKKEKLKYSNVKEVTHKKGCEEKELFECKYCKKVLKTKDSLNGHYKTHFGGKIICEHCGKRFLSKRKLLVHCKAKHGYEKTDKCSYCDYQGSTAELVKIHERLHTGERPFSCAQCGAGFHRQSSYLQHVAIHLPDKTVQCDQCPARFKSGTLMRIHKQRHRASSSLRFRCEVCGGTFTRRTNVVRHLARVHTMTPDPKHIKRIKI